MIERDGGFVVFRFERVLPESVERVWAALTEPVLMERWFGSRPELDLRPGGAYVVVHGDGTRVVDRVLRVQSPSLFEHTFWESANPDATVTWELAGGTDTAATDEDALNATDAAGGTVLTFTHRLSDADLDRAASTVAAADDRGLIIARNAEGWRRLLDRLAVSLEAWG